MGNRNYITKEQLQDLVKKYNIGKKPLSKLLGWGETTVLLYATMDEIPQNEYSERLYQLYVDKRSYLEVLIKNMDRITDVAFRKSILALHKPIFESHILSVAQFVFDRAQTGISQAHLEVILMWSQILSLRLYDKTLFEDIYQPSKGNGNSPYRTVAEGFKNRVFFNFRENHNKAEMEENVGEAFRPQIRQILTDESMEIIDHVIETFSWYGEKAYVSLLAAERYRICGPLTSKARRSASNDMLKKIYNEVFDQAKVRKLKDFDSFM